MRVKHTIRGFDRIEFSDGNGVACSLQMSSAATRECIWLGCNDADPQQLIPGAGWQPVPMPAEYNANTRMHLTRAQVKKLLPHLQAFAETGNIRTRTPEPPQ